MLLPTLAAYTTWVIFGTNNNICMKAMTMATLTAKISSITYSLLVGGLTTPTYTKYVAKYTVYKKNSRMMALNIPDAKALFTFAPCAIFLTAAARFWYF